MRGTLPSWQQAASRVLDKVGNKIFHRECAPMPPIIKENESLTATLESPARSGATNGEVKQQPVALEVPVTVNGARAMDGSDKREPFSETTKTVLIFGNGAVIRLTSSVAPGQLLFLTNERTKKEVVCQVVKSKNYRNVSGYVELEFTEPVVGFWGMRFPGDRLGSASPAPANIPPAAVSAPAPPRPVSPIVPPMTALPAHSNVPASSSTSLHSSPGSSLASSIVPPALDSASLLGSPKPRPTEIPVPPAPAAATPVSMNPPASAVPQAPKESVSPVSLSPTTPNFDSPRQADQQASFLAPPEASKTPGTIDLSSLAPFFETRPSPGAGTHPPQPPAGSDAETEELKQHTARLQEQLSSMLFTEPEAETHAAAKVEKKESKKSLAEVVELPKPAAIKAEPVVAQHVEPVKTAPEKKLSSMEEEELKIPAWLEPLARNSSVPTSTQELVLREKAKRVAEQADNEEISTGLSAPPIMPVIPAAKEEESGSEVHVPEFGSTLAIDESRVESETHSKRSNKGLLLGAIAAGVLLAAAGGWWYVRQQPAATPAAATSASNAPVSSPSVTVPDKPQGAASGGTTLQVESPVSRNAPAETSVSGQNKPAPSSGGAAQPSLSVVSVRNSKPASNTSAKGNTPVVPANSRQTAPAPAPAPEEGKRAGLGEVRLAAPKLSKNRVQSSVEPDAGVSLGESQTENSDALDATLSVGNKQPAAPAAAAPVAVGGDVKQAKLISRVDPVYPMLAKNQHVAGNVTIDALIDANGRVTSTKIVSGPTLLQQAAVDALKQWKYQPATLDGKPVPMHLTVTLQFRLQ